MRSDMTETVCEHSKQTLQLDENYYPATFQMACLEAVDKNYQNAKNKFEEIAVLVRGNINHQDWCGLSLKEVLYVFRCNIWIAKIALIEAGESSIGLPVATAKNSAFAFIKTPILEKSIPHFLLFVTKSLTIIELFHAFTKKWSIKFFKMKKENKEFQ